MLLTNALGVLLSLALTGLNVEARQPDDPLLSRAVNGPEPSWVDVGVLAVQKLNYACVANLML